MSCRIIISDEVNIKIEGLPVDVRRKIANTLKWEVPYARYLPQYKLGRWDGKIGFFGLGGSGYVNHIGLVVSKKCEYSNERYLVVHNIGEGQNVEDFLFADKIVGHYSYEK